MLELSIMGFSSHFRFSLVLANEAAKMFIYVHFLSLTCLALQTETIIKKITQPKLPKMKNELTKICNESGNRNVDGPHLKPNYVKKQCSLSSFLLT